MLRFRDMMTYWSKIGEKTYSPHLAHSFGVTPCEFFDETRVMGLSDGQTDGHVAIAKTRASVASCG